MNKYYLPTILSLSLIVIGCASGESKENSSATFYVSQIAGNNINNGSEEQPFKTIQKALDQIDNEGGTIYVMTGIYEESINIYQNNMTLTAYPGSHPIIDGKDSLPGDWKSLIEVEGNNNIISGFELRNSNYPNPDPSKIHGGFGIEVQAKANGNIIKNMRIHHTWEHGILIHGDDNIVEDSTIWQTAIHNHIVPSDYAQEGGWGAGLAAGNNTYDSGRIVDDTENTIFRRNTVYNNWGEGIACYEVNNCTIEDNISYDNWTVNLYLSDAINSLVQRNLVYISSAPVISFRDMEKQGISLADEFTAVHRSSGNKITNNLVYNANFQAFYWSVSNLKGETGLNNVLISHNTIINGSLYTGGGDNQPEGLNIINKNTQIINNIITGTNNYISSSEGIIFSSNNWPYRDKNWLRAVSSTDIIGDPLIVEIGETAPGFLTPDFFKLREVSPLINSGTALQCMRGEKITDFFNNERCANKPDIGAHEFN